MEKVTQKVAEQASKLSLTKMMGMQLSRKKTAMFVKDLMDSELEAKFIIDGQHKPDQVAEDIAPCSGNQTIMMAVYSRFLPHSRYPLILIPWKEVNELLGITIERAQTGRENFEDSMEFIVPTKLKPDEFYIRGETIPAADK